MSVLPRFTGTDVVDSVRTIRTGLAGAPFRMFRECPPEGCPPGTECKTDVGFLPGSRCCPADTTLCRGVCQPACPAPKYVEPVNCGCVCPGTFPPACVPPFRQDKQTCLCECDLSLSCPAVGQIRDPVSCTCQCPPGEIVCNGLCVNPLTDPRFCGGCPGDTCNPYDQKCCHGACTTMCTDANCRDCNDKMPPGLVCCNVGPGALNCGPTKLGTKANCQSCGHRCTGGRDCLPCAGGPDCVNGRRCDCPPGRPPCGAGCCGSGQTCCGGTCCGSGQICCGGTCCSGPCCGGGCCGSGQVCCGGLCCPTGFFCCTDQFGNCCPNGQRCCVVNGQPTCCPP